LPFAGFEYLSPGHCVALHAIVTILRRAPLASAPGGHRAALGVPEPGCGLRDGRADFFQATMSSAAGDGGRAAGRRRGRAGRVTGTSMSGASLFFHVPALDGVDAIRGVRNADRR